MKRFSGRWGRRGVFAAAVAGLVAVAMWIDLRVDSPPATPDVLSIDQAQQVVLPSGKDARLVVNLGLKAKRSTLRVTINGEDVTREFRFQKDAAVARIEDLRRGENHIEVSIEDEDGNPHTQRFALEASGIPEKQDLQAELHEVVQNMLAIEQKRWSRPNPARDMTESAHRGLQLLEQLEARSRRGDQESFQKLSLIDSVLDAQLSAVLESYEEERAQLDAKKNTEGLEALAKLEDVMTRATEEMHEILALAGSGRAKDVREARERMATLTRPPKEQLTVPTLPEERTETDAPPVVPSIGELLKKNGGAPAGGDPQTLLDEPVEESRDQVRLAGLKIGETTAQAQASCASDADLRPATGVWGHGESCSVTTDAEDLIVKKAAELNHDPVEIYEFVRNEIEFDLYHGMTRGAHATLLAKSGNDADQAALLVALLRASGYKARFVVGDIVMPKTDAASWMKMQNAGKIWAAMQYFAPKPTPTGNDMVFYDHWWVKAYLPYGPDQGRDVSAPKRWLFMDPSFKQHESAAGLALDELNRPDLGLMTDPDGAGVDPDEVYLAGVKPESPIEFHLEKRLEQLRATHPGKTLADAALYGPIIPLRTGALPASLPYKPLYYHLEFADVDDLPMKLLNPAGAYSLDAKDLLRPRILLNVGAYVSDIACVLAGEPNPCFHMYERATLVAADVAHKNVTVRWVYSPADQDTLDNDCQGDIGFCSAAVRASLRPTAAVYVDDVLQPSGSLDPVPLVPDTPLIVKLGTTSAYQMARGEGACAGTAGLTETCMLKEMAGKLTVGSRWVFGWDLGQSSQGLQDERIKKLLGKYHSLVDEHRDVVNIGAAAFPLDEGLWNDLVDELLFVVALEYGKRRKDLYDGLSAAEKLHVYYEGFSQVRADYDQRYFFETPVTVMRGPFRFDLGASGGRPRSTFGGDRTAFEIDMHVLNGLNGSYLEHEVWETVTQLEAISTVKGIQLAAQRSSQDVRHYQNNPGSVPAYSECTGMQAQMQSKLSNSNVRLTAPTTYAYLGPSGDETWKGCVYYSWNSASSTIFATIQGISGYALNGGAAPVPLLPPGTDFFDYLGTVAESTPVVVPYRDPEVAQYGGTGNVADGAYIGDPVNIVSGNLYHTETDFSFSTRGSRPLMLERTYNSQVQEKGPFGYGWTHTYDMYIETIDDDVDGTPEYGAGEDDVDDVSSGIRLVDGRGAQYVFAASSIANGPYTAAPGNPMRLVKEPVEGTDRLVIYTRDGLRFVFGAYSGNSPAVAKRKALKSTTDANGNTFALTYDGSTYGVGGVARLQQVCDPLSNGGSRCLTFAYTGTNSHIDSVTDWTGRSWTYHYTTEVGTPDEPDLATVCQPKPGEPPAGNPSPVACPGGDSTQVLRTRYTYYENQHNPDSNHNLKRREDALGHGMTFTHYPNDKAYGHVDDEGAETRFAYDVFRRMSAEINAYGERTEHWFDTKGRLRKVVRPDGSFETFEHDDDGNLIKRWDATGIVTEWTYDEFGNVKRAYLPGFADKYTEYKYYWENHAGTPVTDAKHNLVVEQTDPRGTKSYFDYDTAGRLLVEKVKMTVGGSLQTVELRRYEYDAFGNVERTIENIDVATPSVDTTQDLSANHDRVTEFVYDASGFHLETVRDTFGNETENIWDTDLIEPDRGQIREVKVTRKAVYPEGPTQTGTYKTTIEYDTLGRPTGAMSALGRRTRTVYDGAGRPVKVEVIAKDASGTEVTRQASTTYDNAGRVVSSTNPLGGLTQIEYDLLGRPIKAIDANGHSAKTAYDAVGNPVRVTDPMGAVTSLIHDAAGRVIQVSDPTGFTTTATYDDRGRLVESSIPAANITTTYAFDDVNLEFAGIKDPRANATPAQSATSVDPETGAVQTTTDLLNANGHTATTYYDELGRVTRVVDANDDETTFEYDLLGNTTKITDANSHSTIMHYDRLGRLDWRQDALGKTEYFTYDSVGNVISHLDRNGDRTQFYYSFANLQATIVYADGREEVFGFDGFGNQVLARSSEVTYTFAHDALGRPVRQTDSRFNNALRFTYDPVGNLLSRTDFEGRVTQYRYDSAGRLITIGVPGRGDVERHYNAAGRMVAQYMPSKAGDASKRSYITYAYDDARRVSKISHKFDLIPQSIPMTYAYDPNGNILQEKRNVRQDNFQYDALNRLVTAAYNDTSHASEERQEQRFSYDAVGNRVYSCGAPDCASPGSNEELWMGHDEANRLTAIFVEFEDCPPDLIEMRGSTEVCRTLDRVFDNNGNYIRRDRTLNPDSPHTFAYDKANRLIHDTDIKNDETKEWAYQYDAFGQRISQQSPELANRQYVWSAGNRIAEYDSGTLQAAYIHGGGLDDVVARIAGTASVPADADLRYFHRSLNNSVFALSSGSGQRVGNKEYAYEAFGSVRAEPFVQGSPLTDQDLTFTGRELDSNGLMYYRGRFYDPGMGRFMNEDPAGFGGSGTNLYAYVGNNPLGFTDPLGLTHSGAQSAFMGSGSTSATAAHGFVDADELAGTIGRFRSFEAFERMSSLRANTEADVRASQGDLEWWETVANGRLQGTLNLTGIDAGIVNGTLSVRGSLNLVGSQGRPSLRFEVRTGSGFQYSALGLLNNPGLQRKGLSWELNTRWDDGDTIAYKPTVGGYSAGWRVGDGVGREKFQGFLVGGGFGPSKDFGFKISPSVLTKTIWSFEIPLSLDPIRRLEASYAPGPDYPNPKTCKLCR